MKKTAAYLARLSEGEYGISGAISAVTNYFLDSYFAKVDERAERHRAPPVWYPDDPHAHIRELWLGCELHTAVTLNRSYPSFARSLQAWAFSRLFAGPQATYDAVKFLDEYPFKAMLKNHYAYRLQSEQIQISPGQCVTLPVYGNFFVRHKGTGAQIFVTLDLGYESMGCSITVMSSPACQEAAEQFLADMDASIVANDIYYRQCLTFVRGNLDFIGVTKNSWNDIILKEEVKQNIRDNTVNILDHMEALAALGMCPNRNVILISPPGMAKTTIFRAVSCEIDQKMTRIWCTGKSIGRADDVTSLFQAARSLAPCIIFIEDMDLFGRDRTSGMYGSDNHVLNEFLACLDGMQENAGVVVMASTNDIASMDEALVNRPGRFDVKIEIPYPDEEDRLQMLASFLKKLSARPDASVTPQTWRIVLELTEGLTGAYIKELAKCVVIRSVSAGRCSGGSVDFCADDLTASAQQVMDNYRIGQKAKKHITLDVSEA